MSSIMSILVHALNLRLSADEKVDFSPSGKGRLTETSQERRWLECILTRDHFRTPWCSLIVALLWNFGWHQLRLCIQYATLIYPHFLLKCSFFQFSAKAQYAHYTPNYAFFGFLVLLPPVSSAYLPGCLTLRNWLPHLRVSKVGILCVRQHAPGLSDHDWPVC